MRQPTLATLCLLVTALPLAAQQPKDFGPWLMPDRAAEIALARTAAPKGVTDSATILVMTRSGFVEAVHGSDGFTCAVFRSFAAPSDDPNLWNVKISAPQCFNAPGTRTILPMWLKRMEWILGGATPAEADARTTRAYASHQFPAPAPGAMAYMLSPEQYLSDANPHWKPHLMFFYTKALSASTFGAGDGSGPVIDGSSAVSDAPFVTILIPVRQWSDGSNALPPAGK
ncbi:MAG TPA: hypothetical protein VFI39_10535 [Gemmatimonadales bacterium]|nr:hypothetical protein [Gemmatimonadales bacterium]